MKEGCVEEWRTQLRPSLLVKAKHDMIGSVFISGGNLWFYKYMRYFRIDLITLTALAGTVGPLL
jgi:hypothetical protein